MINIGVLIFAIAEYCATILPKGIVMADRSDRIAHDLPEFDATMRRLVRVPKGEVVDKREPKRAKGKSNKNH